MKLSAFILALVVVFVMGTAQASAAPNKYVGVKACTPCHKAGAVKVADIWTKSQHASAYKTLTTPEADKIAKDKGFKTKAAETKECLDCHTIQAKAEEVDKTFDMKDGVQCESCHGAGSAYKAMATMKDHAKSVAAGLTEFKDKAAIEAKCKSCHNEKSPTFKGFKFDEMYPKIKHSKKS